MSSKCCFGVSIAIILKVVLGFGPLFGSFQQPVLGLNSASRGLRMSGQPGLDQEPALGTLQNRATPTWRAQHGANKSVILVCNLIAVALAVIFVVVKCYGTIGTRASIKTTRRLLLSSPTTSVTTTCNSNTSNTTIANATANLQNNSFNGTKGTITYYPVDNHQTILIGVIGACFGLGLILIIAYLIVKIVLRRSIQAEEFADFADRLPPEAANKLEE